jgi:hypothetical protein
MFMNPSITFVYTYNSRRVCVIGHRILDGNRRPHRPAATATSSDPRRQPGTHGEARRRLALVDMENDELGSILAVRLSLP